jgi:hypothetical protein
MQEHVPFMHWGSRHYSYAPRSACRALKTEPSVLNERNLFLGGVSFAIGTNLDQQVFLGVPAYLRQQSTGNDAVCVRGHSLACASCTVPVARGAVSGRQSGPRLGSTALRHLPTLATLCTVAGQSLNHCRSGVNVCNATHLSRQAIKLGVQVV